jgi:hypothetical protein
MKQGAAHRKIHITTYFSIPYRRNSPRLNQAESSFTKSKNISFRNIPNHLTTIPAPAEPRILQSPVLSCSRNETCRQNSKRGKRAKRTFARPERDQKAERHIKKYRPREPVIPPQAIKNKQPTLNRYEPGLASFLASEAGFRRRKPAHVSLISPAA